MASPWEAATVFGIDIDPQHPFPPLPQFGFEAAYRLLPNWVMAVQAIAHCTAPYEFADLNARVRYFPFQWVAGGLYVSVSGHLYPFKTSPHTEWEVSPFRSPWGLGAEIGAEQEWAGWHLSAGIGLQGNAFATIYPAMFYLFPSYASASSAVLSLPIQIRIHHRF
jgi:hypothetical protein